MAEVAARILLEDELPTGVITLAGQRITKADVAQALAEASGKPVELVDVSREDYQKGLEDAGLPAPVAQMFAATDEVAREGAYDADSADFERILGRAPRLLRSLLRSTWL